MAIGVSYMGHDGRRADFTTEGNPTPGSALDQLVRGGTGGNPLTPLAEQMRRARRPQAPDPRTDKAAGTVRLSEADRRPGTLTEKMKRGGSVVASENGVCLKGEEQVAGNGVYAKNGEKQGFLTLDEIDNPNAKGGVVGEADSQNRLTPSNKTSSDKEGAFGVNMQSRTEAEVNEETGEVTFWEYTKRWDVTNGRRVGEVSGETKRKICSFFLGSGDRQITYIGPTPLFSIARTVYKDEDGKLKHEYWVKICKWIADIGMFLENNGTPICNMTTWDRYSYLTDDCYHGVYPIGTFGHYPVRPENRPRKLTFDSGREIPVEWFEEDSNVEYLGSNNNAWTYMGCSDDFNDGKASFYFYTFSFKVPHKKKFVEAYTTDWSDLIAENKYSIHDPIWGDHDEGLHLIDDSGNERIAKSSCLEKFSAHWVYEFRDVISAVATTEEYKDAKSLIDMLDSHGSIIREAMRNNEDFASSSYDCEIIFDGESVWSGSIPQAIENYICYGNSFSYYESEKTAATINKKYVYTWFVLYGGGHVATSWLDFPAFLTPNVGDLDKDPTWGKGYFVNKMSNVNKYKIENERVVSSEPAYDPRGSYYPDQYHAFIVESKTGDVKSAEFYIRFGTTKEYGRNNKKVSYLMDHDIVHVE